jgi:hypothetical protein
MAVDRNKLEDLLKQLAGELQNEARQSAESPIHPSHSRSGENGTPPVRSFFGVWDSGNPHSADNDRIDADLPRECASSHEADS